MSRYNKSIILNDDNGKRKLSTTILPFIPSDASDVYIITTTDDRLDLLANKFYGDATKWWIIATANGLGKGTLLVPGNTRLRIPLNTRTIQDQIELFNGSR